SPASRRPAWHPSHSRAGPRPTSRKAFPPAASSRRSSRSCSPPRTTGTLPSPDMADALPTSDDPLAGLSADELLRVLGHEMGNLVTIVSGYGQMLRDHWPFLGDDRRLDIVGRMNRQVDQLRVLIDNFQHLRWLTVASAGPNQRSVRADLSDLVEGIGDDLVPLAADHPLDMYVEPDLPPAYADRSAVQHILMNLVVNATKFSPAEAPIRIDVVENEDGVRFSVSDHG